jgi:hypothetical protein
MRADRIRVPARRLRRALRAVNRTNAPLETRTHCLTWANAVKARMGRVDAFSLAATMKGVADGYGVPWWLRWRLRRLGDRLEARA